MKKAGMKSCHPEKDHALEAVAIDVWGSGTGNGRFIADGCGVAVTSLSIVPNFVWRVWSLDKGERDRDLAQRWM